jgi:AI-2E family transporter
MAADRARSSTPRRASLRERALITHAFLLESQSDIECNEQLALGDEVKASFERGFLAISSTLLRVILRKLVVMTICWQGVVPFVVGRRMTLSPVAVFVMIIVLGWMWGVIGALVAVPVLASLKIICDRIGSLRPISEFLSP